MCSSWFGLTRLWSAGTVGLPLLYLLYTRFGRVPSWLASLPEGTLIPSALIACVLLNLCGLMGISPMGPSASSERCSLLNRR